MDATSTNGFNTNGGQHLNFSDFELKQAQRKEQLPRTLDGNKISNCNECRKQWRNYKDMDYGLCQARGFRVRNPEEMCRFCPLYLYEE